MNAKKTKDNSWNWNVHSYRYNCSIKMGRNYIIIKTGLMSGLFLISCFFPFLKE